MATYLIPECNIETLRSKMDQVRKKCEKYGCEFVYNELGNVYKEESLKNGEKIVRKYIEIEAEGIGQINDWQFVATVEHLTAGNVIRKYDDSIEVPERYNTCGAWCEHCNKIRDRKDSYIVKNTKSGEFKMVGKACLKDFTNGLNADRVANLMTYIDSTASSLGEWDEESLSSGRWNCFGTKSLVAATIATIGTFGYVNASTAAEREIPSTKSRVEITYTGWGLEYMRNDREREKYESAISEYKSGKFDEEAEEIVNYFCNLTDDEITSEYMRSMHILFCEEYLEWRNLGFAVSAVPTYRKHKGMLAEKAEREKATSNSEYVGEEGQRLDLTIKNFRYVTSWENAYGVTYMYQFIDTNDNVFVWYKSGCISDSAEKELSKITADGNTFSMAGTVKQHKDYHSTKQTVLQRCSIKVDGKKVA